jgi:hypothetical protein
MNTSQFLIEEVVQAQQILRGKVLMTQADGLVLVGLGDQDLQTEIVCEVLWTSEQAESLKLYPDDMVLVWLQAPDSTAGVVLGRIGPGHAPVANKAPADELVLEATDSLTLKCGEGSITLRRDGKILIKGTDLVSHAKRMNRIRGGGVAIN